MKFNRKLLVISSVAFLGSGCFEVENLAGIEPHRSPQKMDLREFDQREAELQERLRTRFLEKGYVVSRKGEKPHFVGDSLLWTGIAMGVLDCEIAREIFEAVHASAKKRRGGLVRIEPLPRSYNVDPTSRDMEVGAIFGFAAYFLSCEDPEVVDLLTLHFDFIDQNHAALYPHGDPSKININPAFAYFLNEVAALFLGVPRPPAIDRSGFEVGVFSGASGIRSANAPCFPVHLTTMQLITLEILDHPISQSAGAAFCKATDTMGLPLTDWYCHRLDVKEYLHSYELDQYEYSHQRCSWEQDRLDGVETPGLDWIVLKRLAQGLQRK